MPQINNQRIINQIRNYLALPDSVTDQQIQNGLGDSDLWQRIQFRLAWEDVINHVKTLFAKAINTIKN